MTRYAGMTDWEDKVRELCIGEIKRCEVSEMEFHFPWRPFLQNLSKDSSNKWAAHIKEFGSYIKKLEWKDVKFEEVEILSHFLPRLFTVLDSKDLGCRAVRGILQSLPVLYHENVVNTMATLLCETISAVDNTDKQQIQNMLCMLRTHLENFKLGEECVKQEVIVVLSFLAESLAVLVSESRSDSSTLLQSQAMQQCLVLIKTGLTVIQKCSSSITSRIEARCMETLSSLETLLRLLATILKTDMFLADCRSAGSLMFALICKTWIPSGKHLVDMVASMFHYSKTSAVESSHLHHLTSDLCQSVPDLSCLYLCHGFIVMLELQDLIQDLGQGNTLMLDVFFPQIYQLTQRLANSSSSLAAARTLCQWVEVTANAVESTHLMSTLSGPSPIPQKLLMYVMTHWDHPIDGIRHQTKAIFEGVMKLHVKSLEGIAAHQDPFTLDILSTLVNSDWHTRGKYGVLGCMVEVVGASHVINLYPGILQQLLTVMSEHAMATHSCEVIEKLFNQHKKELEQMKGNVSIMWNETWIIPILDVLSDQTKPNKQKGFIIDYLIPKLLKCHPTSLEFIIQHLSCEDSSSASRREEDQPTSDAFQPSRSPSDGGRLGALLSCLKMARSLGLLRSVQGADNTKKKKRNKTLGEEEQKKKDKSDLKEMEDEKSRVWKGFVPVRLLYQAVSHSTHQIRIDTIGLLCDSNKTTEDVSQMDLSLLIFALALNLNNSSPSFRQQFISHIKKLLVRLRESGRILLMKSQRAGNSNDNSSGLHIKYKEFLEWLCSLMFDNLSPGFGYPCRATSLQILTAIHSTFNGSSSGLFDISLLWCRKRVNLLVMRLMDNYESNRIMAFDLLASLPPDILGLQDAQELEDCYRVAYNLAVSNKPYNCETAAFVFRLLIRQTQPRLHTSLSKTSNVEAKENQPQARLDVRSSIESNTICVIQNICDTLEGQVEVAGESLLEAAVQGPMYGLLHCLRILLRDTDLRMVQMADAWKCIITRFIQLCFDVAEVAAKVVCNSSPEGFIPSEQKQVIDEECLSVEEDGTSSKLETFHVTPQMILVCCWRSMKEVSLLLGELSQRTPMEDGDSEGLITSAQMESIGTFFMKLLRESKHRGAFELAYAGFIQLTSRIWSEPSSIDGLPQQWLSELLQEITSNQSMLCATRRSAGIPFAIQALLLPEPKEVAKPLFHHTMTTLLTLAQPPSDIQDHTARVHALNILRALFRDTKLGQEVLPYIGDGVKAAILGFAAKLWAVRNSATMLFSALISRIFGVKRARDELARKNCMTGREFFSRFPSLHSFLLEQFQHAQEVENKSKAGVTTLHPNLFPCLLLLSRLYPSPNDANNTNMSMSSFMPYVIRAGCSAIHKTRSIAATALVPLVPPNQLVHTLNHLIDVLLGAANHPKPHPNAIHGILIQIDGLLKKNLRESILPESILDDLTSIILPRIPQLMWLASSENKSYITRAVFTSIIKDFFVDSRWMQIPRHRTLLLDPILTVAKNVVHCGELDDVSSSSCPGFHQWQGIFASLCLKLRDTVLLMQTVEEEEEKEPSCNSVSMPPTGQPKLHHQQQEHPERNPSELGCTEGLHLYFLHSTFPEVRMVALSHLVKIMEQSTCQSSNLGNTSTHIGVCNKKELVKLLMDMMLHEEDHQCLAKVCEALNAVLSSPSSSSGLVDDPKTLVRQCIDLAKENYPREEVLASIVMLTGTLLPLMDLSSQVADVDHLLFQSWLNLMKSCSGSERGAQLRHAVAKVILHSATSLLGVPQQHIADEQLSLWDIVVAFLQDDDDDVRRTAARCVMKTTHLIKPMNEFSEFTTETFLRRLNDAVTDVDSCDYNKIKETKNSSDWSILLNSKEEPVSMEMLKRMVETYRHVYCILLSNEIDLVSWDLQPFLLLFVTPYLLSHLHLKQNPNGCLATIIRWVREGGIESTSNNEEVT
ncbi:tRNA (32-2'-O)-methyltransferase regulator THADA-like [Lytechinus pictus]|uniref:tRNA (32-2'-O)-methyltransferase regulator THADA-like n=1 Tax=Lytechinus pictus TaxID=7653 RepID=UPI0030B9D79C